jgi:hypothetical protein
MIPFLLLLTSVPVHSTLLHIVVSINLSTMEDRHGMHNKDRGRQTTYLPLLHYQTSYLPTSPPSPPPEKNRKKEKNSKTQQHSICCQPTTTPTRTNIVHRKEILAATI